MKGGFAAAPHLAVEQYAAIGFVGAAQHRHQCLGHLIERHVGHKAESAVVDADQRNLVRRQLARDAEHRAVAAEHDRDVGLLADCVHAVAHVLVELHVLARCGIEQHLGTGGLDNSGDRQQRFTDIFRAWLAKESNVAERPGHESIMQEAHGILRTLCRWGR